MEKRVAVRYLILIAVFAGLVGFLFILRGGLTGYIIYGGEVVERGLYWDKLDAGGGSYNLRVYNAPVNYYDGSEYVPINYGSCGSDCFRDWNGLIYRVSSDQNYINLYDVNDNLISRFGFGITGEVGGTNYRYSTLNFTWTWSQESVGDKYIFRAYNNNVNFNWTQEFHFYPNQPMKIKNTITNDLANINNAKFWYIQTVGQDDGIWFNGTKYITDTYKSGEFDSLLPQVKFEDYYIFDYADLLENGFNITDFYLGDGSVIGVPGIRVLAIGITKGNSFFPTGFSVSLDPTITISGEGGDSYVGSGGDSNKNFGSLDILKTGSVARTYLLFNISAIPENQKIDNATLCLYVRTKKNQLVNVSYVYVSFDESTITWNNQPCGTGFDNSSACNLTEESFVQVDTTSQNTWKCWNVTNMVGKDYESENKDISMILYTGDLDINEFYSKEYSDSSLWPYLDITYSLADIVMPNITIISPLNQSYNNATILVNISAQDANLDSVWWYNGTDNLTYSEEVYYTFQQGTNIIIAYANDSLGNENSSSVSFFVDSVTPVVSIALPQEGSIYGYNESINLNFSVSDDNIKSCWYNLDGGSNNSITNCQNTTFDVEEDGNYVLNLYANDTIGNEGLDNVSFSIQLGAPTTVLHSPVDTYLASQDATFSYTPTDIDLQSCELWGDFTGSFSLNQTDSSPISGSENTFLLTLSDDSYLWNIKCNDSLGNSAFNGNQTFYVDTIFPDLSLSEPTGAKTTRTITASWSVSDDNLESCWYNVYRGESVEVANTSANCSASSGSFDVTVDADFTFNFYVNDSAGNINTTSLSFSVDTGESPPPGNGGGGSGGGGGGGSAPILDKLEISKIAGLIVDPGESRKMILHAKNIGSKFLNDCKLKGQGENADWLSSEEVKGLGAGEEYDFIFTLNIPETLRAGSYDMEVAIICQESNKSVGFVAEIIEKRLAVDLVDVERQKDRIKIIYSLTELSNLDQKVEIEIILFGVGNERLAEITETRSIEASSSEQFETLLDVSGELEGNFNLLINAISETSSSFVQEEIVLGSPGIGGLAVLGEGRREAIFSVVLVAVFAVFAFFIVRRILKFRKLGKSEK